MPVEVAIWKLGEKVDRGSFEPMPSESQLEDILAQDVAILDPNALPILRHVPAAFGTLIEQIICRLYALRDEEIRTAEKVL